MRNARPVALVALAFALVLCGCEREHIEVTVAPRPDGSVTRTVRLWRTDSNKPGTILPPSPAQVEAAQPHYKERLADTGNVVAFRGTFRTLPADIRHEGDTNHGGYTVWTSRLGHVGYYRERRPGSIDFAAGYEKICPAIDLLARVAATMARQQLKGEKGVERLAKFIEGDLRHDLKQTAYLLLRPYPGGEEMDAEKRFAGLTVFAFQYLEERGYIQLRDLPRLIGGDDKAAEEFALSFIARRMGRPADDRLREKLAFLKDNERLDAAFKQALEAHGMTMEEFEKKAGEPLKGVIAIDLFGSNTKLHIVLTLPANAEAFLTSGKQEKAEIRWDDTIVNGLVTDLFYVAWAVPDGAWQTRRLGRVAVTGETLSEYVVWENGLRPDALARWRAALDRLDPKADLKAQLSAIRLKPPEADAKPSPEEGAQLILKALKPQEDR